MTTIVAGYDFGPQEIPNRAKLLQMATGLQVRDLDSDRIPGTFIRTLDGDVSGTSGATLPAIGWLWADPGGNLWVEQFSIASGAVTNQTSRIIWRAEGGWVSGRWMTLNSFGSLPGNPFVGVAGAANNTEPAVTFRQEDQGLGGNGRTSFVNMETNTTGAADLIGRGMANYGLTTNFQVSASEAFAQQTGIRDGGGGGQWWFKANMKTAGERQYQGWFGGINVNTTEPAADELYEDAIHGYFYGIQMKGPGTTS